MPEALAATIGAELWAAGLYEAGIFVEAYGAIALQIAAVTASTYTMREQQRKAQNSQRAAYEASLKDRYVMVRSATAARRVVLGRQRVSGPIAYIGSYGANRQYLVFCVVLAAHEIDAVEAVYFDDELVTLDGSGNVTGVNRRDLFTLTTTGATFTLSSEPAAGTVTASVAYGTTVVSLGVSVAGSAVTVSGGTSGQTGTVTIQYQPAASPWVVNTVSDLTASITTDGAGTGSVTLANPPVGGSVRVFWGDPSVSYGDTANNAQDVTSYAAVAGSTITVTGCPFPSAPLLVQYRDGTFSSRARVKSYLGAPGQVADTNMIANLSGVWTSAHVMAGLAYLRIELDYDPDAFPGGLPNVSARIRGAKLYDPRTGTTVWSQNPALMMRHVATSPLLGRLDTSAVNDTSVSVAATICDGSAAYVVQGQTYTRALYTAGLVVGSDTRAKDALDDLAKAMAGRWCFVDGQMRVKAGAYVTPLQSLDETWLSGGQSVQVQPKAARGDVFNVAAGKFSDETRDYIVVDYPRVTAASYVTEDGAELPIDVTLNAVTFVGQAQQVMAVQMRDARQGLRVTLTCNMRAYPVEPFDTLTVTLSRFGWVAKVFEVLDVSWTIDGGIQLVLKETDPSIWALGTSFAAADPAPNTLFPSPFKVPAITSLACASGTGQLLRQADGTVQTRVQVTWAAINDALVLNGGGVEVRYGLATAAESTWQSVMANDRQTTMYLTENLRDGQLYLVKARATNTLVNGAWCLPVLHQVIGKTAAPTNVAGLAAVNLNGDVIIVWTPNTEADYAYTEVRYGASFSAGTFIGRINGNTLLWAYGSTPGAGTYTLWAKHVDTSKNGSTPVSTSITVTVPTLSGLDSTASAKLAGIASGATKNTLTYSASAPGSPTDGDIWVDTSVTPNVLRSRVSGAWVASATYATNTNQLTDGANLGSTAVWASVTGTGRPADYATKNSVTYSATAPSSPTDGDIWVDTSVTPNVTRVRVSGAWQVGANLTTNTNQLTDGANLGSTAVWTGVSGTGKPADYATKNTVSYSSSAPSSPTDGDLWCDTSATPAVWKIRVSGAWQPAANYTTGALANLNTVGTAQIDANAATVINTQSISSVTVSQLSGSPNNTSFFWTDIATYTFTAAHTGSVTVTAIGGIDIATSGSGFGRAVLYTSLDVGSVYGADLVYQVDISIGLSASYRGNFAHTREIAVTSGSTYTVTLRGQKFETATTTTLVQGAMRTEQIKR